ncbi:hypothetical protein ACFVIM_24475 [Streptomyces sp. NPDC057638]|uniref:hypothetical protein n=1 Tax=Streptomyces sp. NPDC057638 TaxID=3346190 RepID=UPI00369A5678
MTRCCGWRLGYQVSEHQIWLDKWRAGCASGEITEVFTCGTAAGVTPVGTVRDTEDDWTMGPVTHTMRESLTVLQHGPAFDPDACIHRVG